MADISTIARPYAEALYKVCERLAKNTQLSTADSLGIFHKVSAWLEGLNQIYANEGLVQFIKHPNASSADIVEVLLTSNPVASDFNLELATSQTNFIKVLVEVKRFDIIPFLSVHFLELVQLHSGIVEGLVESAYPLSAQQKNELQEVLEKKFSCKLSLSESLEPSLIGGVRVTIGDEVLDYSVSSQIEKLRNHLLI